MDRRTFLGTATGALPGGLTLALSLEFRDAQAASAQPVFTGRASASTPGAAINAWLTIEADNSVSLFLGAAEMGQGSLQALAQILCEDLMVDPQRVRLLQGAPTQAAQQPVGAAFNTAGSGAIRNNYARLRLAGAQARETLVAAAMTLQGDRDRTHYEVADGVITHLPTGTRRSYGSVATPNLPPVTTAGLVPDAQLRSIGRSVPRADIPAKVTGQAVYGIDVRIPGMLYASVVHCPVFGGTLKTAPASTATMKVVPLKVVGGLIAPNGVASASLARGRDAAGNTNAVAVVMLDPAATSWDAMQAAKGIKPQWTIPGDSSKVTSAALLSEAKALLQGGAVAYQSGSGSNTPATLYTVESQGPVSTTLAETPVASRLSAVYSVPLVSHACMEVLNATVRPSYGAAGELSAIEVWASTQVARSAQLFVMALTGLPESKVSVQVTLLGGGLGRRLEVDFISQAVQTALAMKKPVKLIWSREEDFAHDQYRPMAAVKVTAALGGAGHVKAWSYRVVSDSIAAQRGRILGATGDGQGHEGAAGLPYRFGSRLTEYVTPKTSPIPVGYWRSVGASMNTFAVESMIDEIATATKVDPVLYRQAQLTDTRWLKVLNGAVQAAGGSLSSTKGSARGVAIGSAFNSIVASVVEVTSVKGAMVVLRVWIAIDCGLVINPNQVEAQLVGGVIHGINAALYGRQVITGGAAQNRNFSSNRMVLRSEAPQTTVVVVNGPEAPSYATAVAASIGGVGELGVPTIAPALANAWFRLTGQRVRDLPFHPNAKMDD